MATIVLLHSALGKTPGIDAIAEQYTAAGHSVFAPDFYEGRTFTTAGEGVGHADEVGFSQLVDRVAAACENLPDELVFAGLSLGAGIAQQMGKNDSRARGALLFHGGGFPKPTRWKEDVPVQIHFSVDDTWRDASNQTNLMESAARAGAQAECFLYPGSSHLFSDPLVADYREDSAQLLHGRSLAFLERV